MSGRVVHFKSYYEDAQGLAIYAICGLTGNVTFEAETVTCPACMRTLSRWTRVKLPEAEISRFKRCPQCEGTGQSSGRICDPCSGIGVMPQLARKV